MSLSVVNSTLSALKACQTDIGTGMDMVTDVALDLVETEGSEEDMNKLEQMILDCARLDREINCFVEAVEQVTTQGGFADSDLQKHAKVVSYNESLRNSQKEARRPAALSAPHPAIALRSRKTPKIALFSGFLCLLAESCVVSRPSRATPSAIAVQTVSSLIELSVEQRRDPLTAGLGARGVLGQLAQTRTGLPASASCEAAPSTWPPFRAVCQGD
ncbi:hypothetical protein JZ751_023774 [Albula glossodonta]|uniref:Uncharacterized protein n=1 Tax=Albula glossodonta TaxID=121402 RepID=A0A8T2NK57_9TELE|nr:hypothetical protein JZ751_023774 [Albula glossodonta]